MSATVSKSSIGAFVLGAIALGVAGVVAFGSGALFEQRLYFVSRFEGSTQGLKVGSPVTLKGVDVGAVSSIELEVDAQSLEYHTAVTASIRPTMTWIDADGVPLRLAEAIDEKRRDDVQDFLTRLIGRGLRAQLSQQSFVTGQLAVALDFHPKSDPAGLEVLDDGRIVIPTTPSEMERLERTLQNIPFEEIMEDFQSAVQGVERVINSGEAQRILTNVEGVTDNLTSLSTRVLELIDAYDAELREVLATMTDLANVADERLASIADGVDETLGEARSVLRNVDARVEPLADDLEQAAEAATAALGQARESLARLTGPLAVDATLLLQLHTTLERVAEASANLSALVSYLELHPEALLKGK